MKGFCMGSADIVPGVSGGTMAFVLGIYTDLMDAIKSFDLVWLRALTRLEWRVIVQRPRYGFLIPLLAGIFMALMFFTRVVPVPALLISEPELVYGLFFGLIAGSIVVLLMELPRFSLRDLVIVASGIAVGHLMFNLVPVQTPDSAWFVFLCGVAGVAAMLLPGISGSFVLLILNKYAYILGALAEFRFSVLLPFAMGLGVGAVTFSRVLSLLLHRHYRPTVQFITGMLIASLLVIWPFQAREFAVVNGKRLLIHSTPIIPHPGDPGVLVSFLLTLAGLVAVLWLNDSARRLREPGKS